MYVGNTLYSGSGCDNPDADTNGEWCVTASAPNACYDPVVEATTQDSWFYCGAVPAAPPSPTCACAVEQLANGICEVLCNNALCEHDRGDCAAEPPQLISPLSPPPPPTPPFAPLTSGALLTKSHETVVSFTSPGTVETFDTATVRASMAAVAGVNESAVSVTVKAGSVLVTVTIAAKDAGANSLIESKVNKAMATPQAASSALGVAVWTTPTVAKLATTVVLPAPSPPQPNSPPQPTSPQPKKDDNITLYIIIGCVGFGVVLLIVIAAIVLCVCRKQNKVKILAAPETARGGRPAVWE